MSASAQPASRSVHSLSSHPPTSTSSSTPNLSHKPAKRQRQRPPQLVGSWQPNLPSRGTEGRGCGHFVLGSPNPSAKVAAFDLDGTVIRPLEGRSFPLNSKDWEWACEGVVKRLREVHRQGYAILFLSNQASPTPKLSRDFQIKLPVVCRKLNVPLRAFAAWEFDGYRKSATGMWDAFVQGFNGGVKVDCEKSFYVGDAAGRPIDHADTDRKFALNTGLPFYTPEEFFLSQPRDDNWTLWGWNPMAWDHTCPDPSRSVAVKDPGRGTKIGEYAGPEVVLLVGAPGVGKSTWAERELGDGWVKMTYDTPKPPQGILNALKADLEGHYASIDLSSQINPSSPSSSSSSTPLYRPPKLVIEASFPSRASRRALISHLTHLFRSSSSASAPPGRIVCVNFDAPTELGKHNAVYEAGGGGGGDGGKGSKGGEGLREKKAWERWEREWEEPSSREGFDVIHPVHFRFSDPDPVALQRWNRFLIDVYPGKQWKTGVVAVRGPGAVVGREREGG
ncbi:hypothetical protein JCM11641_008083 [Rhodosporidiobolus odoratus]